MSETKLKRYLKILQKDLNILREREAKYGGNAPVELLNEIDDHQTAIALAESALAGDISAEQLLEQINPLNVSHDYSRANIIPIPTLPLALVTLSVLGLLSFISYRLVVPTPTPTPLPTSTPTPLPTPSQMSGDFNIAVAEIGQQNADKQLVSSNDGQQLGQWIFTELQNEYKNLPQDFNIQVWHDGPELAAKNVKIGMVADDEGAAKLAERIKANLVIYGNLDGDQNPANFIPTFYIVPLPGETGEIDELKGSFQLGASVTVPIPLDTSNPVVIASLKPEVSLQARVIRWMTIGIIWDLAGQTRRALDTFQQAEQKLKDWAEKKQGKEILYYFIGREALLLGRNEEEARKVFDSAEAGQAAEAARALAESYFNKTLNSNSDYARAFIGLGGVYFQRAKEQQSPEERLSAPELDQAIKNYKQAATHASKLPSEQVELDARLGLAATYKLKGDAYLQLNAYDEAKTYYEGSIAEIQAIILSLTAAKQQRSLGHVYLNLGAAYGQLAQTYEKQDNKAESITLYKQAREAYMQCIAQGAAAQGGNPYDALLKNIIDTSCQPNADRMEQKLLELEEGP
ncbi:MAG: tetratricopeptide repeat protein [Chloroflexi bacterium]|nr:tetratricopeptide repeat protein [Chloroflexota bacterium]